MRKHVLSLAAVCLGCSMAAAQAPTYKKIQLTDTFYCEGANAGDFNKDGKLDIVSGPYWYEGPDFQKKHELYAPVVYDPKGYSQNFLTFTGDFNSDGWTDILQVGWPGKETGWFQNPAGKDGHWKRHLVFSVTDNETPVFADITGDGKPELVFNTAGQLGYAQPDPSDPTRPWIFRPVSTVGKYHKYTHGVGVGDINGDGRLDLLEAKAWWEQPKDAKPGQLWIQHPYEFCDAAAQMYAYDVDGDGLNDVITVEHPHKYGLQWMKQVRSADGTITFEKKVIMGATPAENDKGLKVSQLHAVNLVDINGDGLKDIISGKRFWAHGPKGDVEPDAPAMVLWFQLVRDKAKGAHYVTHVVDDNSGVGLHIEAMDLNGDGVPDFVAANKKGTFVHLSQRKQ